MNERLKMLIVVVLMVAFLVSVAERVYVYARLAQLKTRVHHLEATNDRLFKHVEQTIDHDVLPMDLYLQAR